MKHFIIAIIILASFQASTLQAQSTEAAEYKNRVIKVEFFSPLYGSLNFGYEQYLAKNINLDAGFGIIGIGFNESAEFNKGLFLRFGPRLYFSPDYFTSDAKRYSDFQGWYFRPELQFSIFKWDESGSNGGEYFEWKGNNASMAVLLNIGRQYVIANIVSLDVGAELAIISISLKMICKIP